MKKLKYIKWRFDPDGFFLYACKPAVFQGRTLKTRVSWKGLFQRHKVSLSLCPVFLCCGEKRLWKKERSGFLAESHIFLNERPFATRMQSCFSERAVCPLASDVSYRQAREAKEREQMRTGVMTNFFYTSPIRANTEPLSLLLPFQAVSTFTHYLSSHPSISGIWVGISWYCQSIVSHAALWVVNRGA